MRAILLVALCACSSSVTPRVIAGGGVGDGAIDGDLNIYVIDNDSEAPIANAMVAVGTKTGTTDATGLLEVHDVSGAQTIAVSFAGYEGTVWADVNGANVTVPITALATTPDQATLSGTITDWDTITVAAQHIKAAVVTYSQNDKVPDAANNIATANSGNICGITGATCNWTVNSRTGTVTLIAAIIDRDTKGTATTADDTTTIIGWAYITDITVMANVTQSGLALAMVDAGSLQNATIDLGTPPAALTTTEPVVGVELAGNEVVQMPTFVATDPSTVPVPSPTVFAAGATYRLTVLAETTSAAQGPESAVIRRGLMTSALAAGTWLVPPTNVTASLTNVTFDPVAGAAGHQISWLDTNSNTVLQITDFDPTKTSIDVPSLVALATGAAATVNVSGIGADFDVTNFSLDEDRSELWGFTTQPATLP